MITVKLTKDSIAISGHANYDEYGRDIVCASVSTILQLAQMGLCQLAKQYPDNVEIIEKDNNKQLVQKITYEPLLKAGWQYKCPTCKEAVGYNKYDSEDFTREENFCANCGTELQWEEK